MQPVLTYACPLTAVAEHQQPGTGLRAVLAHHDKFGYLIPDRNEARITAPAAGVSEDYALGFIWGVDGYRPNEHILTTAQALLGYRDGHVVAVEVFNDEPRTRLVP